MARIAKRKPPGVKGTESLTRAREGIRTPNLLIRRYARRGKTPFMGGFHAFIVTVGGSVGITLFHERDSLTDSLTWVATTLHNLGGYRASHINFLLLYER